MDESVSALLTFPQSFVVKVLSALERFHISEVWVGKGMVCSVLYPPLTLKGGITPNGFLSAVALFTFLPSDSNLPCTFEDLGTSAKFQLSLPTPHLSYNHKGCLEIPLWWRFFGILMAHWSTDNCSVSRFPLQFWTSSSSHCTEDESNSLFVYKMFLTLTFQCFVHLGLLFSDFVAYPVWPEAEYNWLLKTEDFVSALTNSLQLVFTLWLELPYTAQLKWRASL